ncbi:hypothetical protein [Streptomyces sp. NPDC005322]|uniref:hypothetical protein n=1 Tax=Streptomyces sp. NPDC005322 TaxID=3157032 RepID=UPI00339F15A1
MPKSVTSETYPENLPGGAKGEQGRFDVDTGADDARDAEYRIGPADTDDDGNSGNTSTDGWQRTPMTTNGFAVRASFSVAPAEDGNHQAEARSVDRADNTGATRVYGFASPSTDTGRASHPAEDCGPVGQGPRHPRGRHGHEAAGRWPRTLPEAARP